MIATFRVFYYLHIWLVTNGAKWTDKWTDAKENVKYAKWTNGAKWMPNGRTNGGNMEKAQIWREWDKWESVCLNIRSHLYLRLMPRIGEPSGN